MKPETLSTIEQLRALWEIEKSHYKKSEVGSGVQSFVWDVLQCPELFNLKRGLKSTATHKRTREFLLEESNKSGQADAVLFIDSEIAIPVEVEKYENAQSGEWQILKYRTAFEKTYGILTDGAEWRFYYGEIQDQKYYEFSIVEMLSDPKRFIVFWEEYVKPKNYYLSLFNSSVGQQGLSSGDKRLPVDKNRERFFNDITDIMRKLKDKFLNAWFFKALEEEGRDKKATEIAYSYLIQFILYKTLADNSYGDYEKDFLRKSHLIQRNIEKESYNSVLLILEGMSAVISENIYKPFHKEQEEIIKQVRDIVHSGDEDLIRVSPFLDIFVFVTKYYFADVQNDIFGAVYENYLKELYEEQQFGQYFTDPSVVNFMLEEIGYTAQEIERRHFSDISIVDPSCGSGTFLYSAVREIVKARGAANSNESKAAEKLILSNVFGLDIAEFPLYLAEMSILMRMLPVIANDKYNNPVEKKLKLFVTEDSVAEFTHQGSGGLGLTNSAQGQLALDWRYEGFMRDEQDIDELKKSVRERASASGMIGRSRFDYVIGNPPYVGYNESAKLGIKIFDLIRDKKSSTSLNDIYGWNLHSIPTNRKKYGPKPNLYAFFMALGFALLKDRGRFCYVIPQTILTSGDHDVIRYQLSKEYTIEKIFTFAGNLFIDRGAKQQRAISTSSLILVCTKAIAPPGHEVECVHLPQTGLPMRDVFAVLKVERSNRTKFFLQQQLRDNVANWNFIQWSDSMAGLYAAYREHSDAIDIYYDHEKARAKFDAKFYFDKGLVFPKNDVRGDTDGDYLLFKNSKGYHPTLTGKSIDRKSIRLPDGSQGVELFDLRYKIVWSYMNPNGFKFTSENIMLDFNWVLIASNSKEEMLYLFGLLTSSLVWTFLNALLKLQNEQSFSLGIKTIKEFVRIPRLSSNVDTDKELLISLVDSLLKEDRKTVGDLVILDTNLQRVDDVWIEGKKLFLQKGPTVKVLEVSPETAVTLDLGLTAAFGVHHKGASNRAVFISELKSIPVTDQHRLESLRAQIDELVLKLYGITGDLKAAFETQIA
jgi:type I restriction-modification system DNA methylase subunit